MTGTTWFAVENNIVDRSDLTIYEKMCCVVLARYAGRNEFSNMLNLQVIAIRMGCDVKVADETIKSLMQKGLIALEDTERIEPDQLFAHAKPPAPPSNVIHNMPSSMTVASAPPEQTKPKPASWLKLELEDLEETEDQPSFEVNPVVKPEVPAKTVKSAETESPSDAATGRPMLPKQLKDEVQSLVDQVYEIIDENINEREARIILSFAGNNIELIRDKYHLAKQAQVKDKIEMLINELQKKDNVAARKRPVRSESAGHEEKSASVTELEQEKPKARAKQANQQVDLNQINSMAAYKQSAYGKKTGK